MKLLIASLLCVVSSAAFACPALLTTQPQPPVEEGLFPARLVRVDSKPVDLSSRPEMFTGLRQNDSPQGSRQILTAPAHDEAPSEVRVQPGARRVEVAEDAPKAALAGLSSHRASARRQRTKPLVIDVAAGREYAFAVKRADGDDRRSGWEPVVWREAEIACGE